MEFAPIGPLWSLEEYVAPAGFQMCLAPYCSNKKYFEFYQRMIRHGKYVILDNGAYEGKKLSDKEYHELILALQPSEYVIPDEIRNSTVTWRFYQSWVKSYGGHIGKSIPAFVCHDGEGEIYSIPEIPPVIHVPKWMGKRRHAVATYLIGKGKTVHALGFIDDNPLEDLTALAALGVRSIDSSEPIWKGMHGVKSGAPCLYKFKNYVLEEKSRFKLIDFVDQNLKEVNDLCQGQVKTTEYGLGIPLENYSPTNANRDITAPRYDLIPKEFLDDLAATFEEGLRYGEDNWKRGDDAFFRDVMNHASGHIANYNSGDRSKPHLAHAAWNLLARAWYDRRKAKVEDKPL